jgi:hypothetical protein
MIEEIKGIHETIDEVISRLSDNYTKIISKEDLEKYPKLDWGKNGIGDRWANKKYNYTSIWKNNIRTYSENDESENIPHELIVEFRNSHQKKGIIGIFVHSKRTNIQKRPIRKEIHKKITSTPDVINGSNTDIVCDHKNDLYNDPRVLGIITQIEEDFQSLSNSNNLQKRQICKWEKENGKLYSAKQIPMFQSYIFEFPWEKKAYHPSDIHCKVDTYWYDPCEFQRKIMQYSLYIYPIVQLIKQRNKIII